MGPVSQGSLTSPVTPASYGDQVHKLYATPGPMTTLPEHPALADLPTDWAGLRAVIQGLQLHRDWAPTYGVTGDAIRLDEQNLRPVSDVLTRAFELSPAPVTQPRRPEERVRTICRHFALLYTAFLRAQGTPARVRCGFSNYFDRTAPDNSGDEVVSTQGGRAGSGGGWYDHWITERW